MTTSIEIWDIAKKCDCVELLVQAAEECSEMAQACCKLLRVMDGKTPVSEEHARAALVEELADVHVTATALEWNLLTLDERVKMNTIEREKIERWKDRIAERTQNEINRNTSSDK